jgi:hypothetical protein
MKRILPLLVLLLFSWISDGEAEDVRVYCRDGSVIEGEIISISEATVKIDPSGPLSLRRFATSEVDSVVSISGKHRVLFPLAEGEPIPDFGQYRRRLAPLTNKFSLTGYVGYRFAHTIEELRVEDAGESFDVQLQIDGGIGAGVLVSHLWTIAEGRSYVKGSVDFALFDRSISVKYPGGRLEVLSGGYMVFDLLLKPMIPIRRGRVGLYASPLFGAGFRLANPREITPYEVNQIPWDVDLALILGGSVDLVSNKNIAASLSVRVVNSNLVLNNVDRFTIPQVRLEFAYMMDS